MDKLGGCSEQNKVLATPMSVAGLPSMHPCLDSPYCSVPHVLPLLLGSLHHNPPSQSSAVDQFELSDD